jgi:hypothetical protein
MPHLHEYSSSKQRALLWYLAINMGHPIDRLNREDETILPDFDRRTHEQYRGVLRLWSQQYTLKRAF